MADSMLGKANQGSELTVVDPMFSESRVCVRRRFRRDRKGDTSRAQSKPNAVNGFLHYVLELWFEKAVKPGIWVSCNPMRYADDFVWLVQYREDATAIEQAIRERFKKFELELHPGRHE
jgi:hypothetical protein